MSHRIDPSENFTAAHEGSAHKSLAIGCGLLAVVFIVLLVLQVDSMMGPFIWLAFALAFTAGTGVFSLMLMIDKEKAAKAH